MFTILQGRCHYLHFIEKETTAQTGYGFLNDTQPKQGNATFEIVRLTPKSVFSQGHIVNTFRRTSDSIPWSTENELQTSRLSGQELLFPIPKEGFLYHSLHRSPHNRRLLHHVLGNKYTVGTQSSFQKLPFVHLTLKKSSKLPSTPPSEKVRFGSHPVRMLIPSRNPQIPLPSSFSDTSLSKFY